MTVHGAGVELHVGDPSSLVPAIPDGQLRVVWDDREGDSPEAPELARNLLGGAVLASLIAAALATDRRLDPARRLNDESSGAHPSH